MAAGPIDAGTVVARSEEPVTAEVDGTVVMMSLGRGKYFGLDAIGTRVWELLAEPRTVSALCTVLRDDYEVDAAECERDVLELLRQMLAEELVRVVDDTAA